MCRCSASGERARYAFLWAGIFLLAACEASAQKPSLEVSFKCNEPVYCASFTPVEREKIRRYLASQLIQDLSRRFRCFDFVERGGTYRLEIELNRRGRSPSLMDHDEVVFWISLVRGDGYAISEEIAWTFRPREEYNRAIGDLASFKTQLCYKLIDHLRNPDQRARLTEALFGGVQLADRAFPIPGTSDWAMPFSSTETGIAEGSQFRVKTHYKERAGVKPRMYEVLANGTTARENDYIPSDYRAKILGETLRPKGDWPSGLEVESVFMIKYEPVPPPLLQPGLPQPGDRRSPVCVQ